MAVHLINVLLVGVQHVVTGMHLFRLFLDSCGSFIRGLIFIIVELAACMYINVENIITSQWPSHHNEYARLTRQTLYLVGRLHVTNEACDFLATDHVVC